MTAEEVTVIVPQDATPFAVSETELVRLTGTAISGATISVKIEGPAKLDSEYQLIQKIKGKTPIGSSVKEFNLKPTGKGKVTATVTAKSPIPGTTPEVKKYEFTVE